MKHIIYLFLCTLLTATIVAPQLCDALIDGDIELVDHLEDEESKESKGEKEVKNVVFQKYTLSGIAEYTKNYKLSHYDISFHLNIDLEIQDPPPRLG